MPEEATREMEVFRCMFIDESDVLENKNDPLFSVLHSKLNSFPKLPDEMDSFRLSGYLGCGSTGVVYKATQEFAVKMICSCLDPDMRNAAKCEYETAKLFSDAQNTMHAIAYYEEDGCSYILQELGESCLYYFASKETTLHDILKTMLDVSAALKSIHDKGYMHFDVKPGNIFIVGKRAKLGDFSLCTRFVIDQVYEKPVGTRAYRAPEISEGSVCSGREDMYSLGITMYALLMGGHHPFVCYNKNDPPRKRGEQIVSLFIHPELLRIIQKAAAYDPTDRYALFEDFDADVRQFMGKHADHIHEVIPAYTSPRRTGPFETGTTTIPFSNPLYETVGSQPRHNPEACSCSVNSECTFDHDDFS